MDNSSPGRSPGRSPVVEVSPAGHLSSSVTALGGSPVERSLPPAASHPMLILSLFPGIDLLGRAFTELGHVVVQGPDILWGQRIEDWHGLPGRFDGVIGGPPCVNYSDANRHKDRDEGDRLVIEFLRVVSECQPEWWLMENVRACPWVVLGGYGVQRIYLDAESVGSPSHRLRLIQFGHKSSLILRPHGTMAPRPVTRRACVTSAPMGTADRYSRRCAAMGVEPIPLPHLTKIGRRRALGNGVPLPMGRALAKAVDKRGPVTAADCHCGCGRACRPGQSLATVACRQRACRSRRGHFRTIEFLPTCGHLP